MLVETVQENGSGVWMVSMVGHRSERFRRVTLTAEDICGPTIADAVLSYSGDGPVLAFGVAGLLAGYCVRVRSLFLDLRSRGAIRCPTSLRAASNTSSHGETIATDIPLIALEEDQYDLPVSYSPH